MVRQEYLVKAIITDMQANDKEFYTGLVEKCPAKTMIQTEDIICLRLKLMLKIPGSIQRYFKPRLLIQTIILNLTLRSGSA